MYRIPSDQNPDHPLSRSGKAGAVKSTAPTMNFARSGTKEVRLAAGLHCPHCGREQCATDFVIDDFGDVQLICVGNDCHRTLLTIGSAS